MHYHIHLLEYQRSKNNKKIEKCNWQNFKNIQHFTYSQDVHFSMKKEIHTTLAKNVSLLISDGRKVYRLISLSVFKSKITNAGGAICFGLPKISAKPVSITHNRSHSSTRIRNVDIIDELSAKFPSTTVAFGAFVRPAADACAVELSDSIVFASQFGYGINTGDSSFEILT